MSQQRLDCVFVIDALPEKANDIARIMQRVSDRVEVMIYNGDTLESVRAEFEQKLHEALESKQNVAVVFDCCAGVRGGIVNTYRRVGESSGNRTRNVLVSCHHGAAINKGFKERGLNRGDFVHVRFDLNERTYLEQLAALFE